MKSTLFPAKETHTEITVVNSRFIATIAPVFSVEEAKTFIGRMKSRYADASHNVAVFVIGHGQSVTAHCNDDGEPSGTAGRPALAVLKGSGLGDAAVVITRYFGGTKLGKGGLVRAYGEAVREVLKITPLAKKVATQTVMIAFPYTYFERICLLIEAHQGKILDKEFTSDVTITCLFTMEDFPEFKTSLKELTHDTIKTVIIETDEATIMPTDETLYSKEKSNFENE
jgi:uncharacterized YigZ family protein